MKLAILIVTALVYAQSTSENFVARMMAFDNNADGKLTRDEITDDRLLSLFHRADVNHDGVVTREELAAVYAKEQSGQQMGRGPGRGPGRGREPGPQQGGILPPSLRDRLNLTADQRKKVDELQKEVDARLAKLLTDEQKRQLKEMRDQGPGRGFGPPR